MATTEKIEEIRIQDSSQTQSFIDRQVEYISSQVGDSYAINALSGGVDSSAVTMLGHRALEDKLQTYFIDNGLMRENESQQTVAVFRGLGINVRIVDAQKQFFDALRGITDPEEKREAVTQTFYRDVFGKLVRESNAKYLLQGTILTDVDETVAGIKRQHNVFAQLGIDPKKEFGYQILEPLVQIRKDSVRKVAEALRLPESIYNKMPFPGPALATRVIGEATPERIQTVRQATSIVEEELYSTRAFQYMAILHNDRVTGIRDGKRDPDGLQIEIRCWDSVDARTGDPTELPFQTERGLADRIVNEVPGVVSVTFNRTCKPPSTIEAI